MERVVIYGGETKYGETKENLTRGGIERNTGVGDWWSRGGFKATTKKRRKKEKKEEKRVDWDNRGHARKSNILSTKSRCTLKGGGRMGQKKRGKRHGIGEKFRCQHMSAGPNVKY